MGLLDKFFKPKKPPKPVSEPRTKAPPAPPPKTAKELANERDEPYIAVLSMDIDPENLHQGSFELDWNEKFISNLIRAGYMMKKEDSDSDIVDRWFQNICRNVVLETYEQEQAMNPQRYVRSKDLGDGRSEVS
jgi:hypothetical protein